MRLLHKDILIKPFDGVNEYSNSVIHIEEREQEQKPIHFYKVLKVSPRVTMIEEGDVVLVEAGMHTIPMMWEPYGRIAITSEEKVIGVIDD